MREDQELADADDLCYFKQIMAQDTEFRKKYYETVDDAFHLYLIRRTDAYTEEE